MRIRPVLMALAILYLVLSLRALALQQADLGEDTRLAKAITVQRGGAPLREVLSDIARQTGVPLRISAGVSSWRACVFAEKIPASQLMSALARTFDLSWRAEGSGYLLYQSSEQRARQEYEIRKAVTERKRQIQNGLRLLAQGRTDQITDPSLRYLLTGERLYVAALRVLTEAEWDSLLRGNSVLITRDRLPPPVARGQMGRINMLGIFYNPLSNLWTFRMYQPASVGASGSGMATSATVSTVPDVLSPQEGSARVTLKPLNPSQVTVPEALLALANATGLAVVAEYYPLTMLPRHLSSMPSTAKSLLNELNNLRLFNIRRTGNLLRFSAQQRAWHRLSDIPHETMAKWMGDERSFGITLAQALDILQLKDLQREALGEWAAFMARRSQATDPVRSLFYSKLADTARSFEALLEAAAHLHTMQKQNLLAGRPLRLSARNPTTREAFLYAASTLPDMNVGEVWIQAQVTQKTVYGAAVVTLHETGAATTYNVTMDTQEQVHQRLAESGIMGTTRWFRANVEEVVFRAGVGAREVRQTVMRFLRYIPDPAK